MRLRHILSRSSIGAPAQALLCFGFLAATAWTGALVGVAGVKPRTFAWLVEGMFVNILGRGGAAAALAGLGIALAAILYGLRELGRALEMSARHMSGSAPFSECPGSALKTANAANRSCPRRCGAIG